jgi:methyl acetate hydrolase
VKSIETGLIPGIVALVADDRGVFYEGAFGRRAVDKPEPMTLDSVFRIASMTKAVTGAEMARNRNRLRSRLGR